MICLSQKQIIINFSSKNALSCCLCPKQLCNWLSNLRQCKIPTKSGQGLHHTTKLEDSLNRHHWCHCLGDWGGPALGTAPTLLKNGLSLIMIVLPDVKVLYQSSAVTTSRLVRCDCQWHPSSRHTLTFLEIREPSVWCQEHILAILTNCEYTLWYCTGLNPKPFWPVWFPGKIPWIVHNPSWEHHELCEVTLPHR